MNASTNNSSIGHTLSWSLTPFNELSPGNLYEILALRCEVFVVEQACIYLDMDGLDPASWHLTGRLHNRLVAYARILPPGLAFEEMSIGRVVTSPAQRKLGAGKELMVKAIAYAIELFGEKPIKIGAQLYLKNFYTSLGFIQCSDTYIEDGIQHIKMIRQA